MTKARKRRSRAAESAAARSRRATFRLRAEDVLRLQKLAERLGLSDAQVLRRALRLLAERLDL